MPPAAPDAGKQSPASPAAFNRSPAGTRRSSAAQQQRSSMTGGSSSSSGGGGDDTESHAGGGESAYIANDDKAATTKPAAVKKQRSAKELQRAFPDLFDTSGMDLSGWWAHRWQATTPVGRIAAVAMVALVLAATLMAAAWVVRDQLRDERLRQDDDAGALARAFLRAQEAVAAERNAALALSMALWAAASPEQAAAAAPPSVQAVPSAGPLNVSFAAAAVATDAAYAAAVDALVEHERLVDLLVDDAASRPSPGEDLRLTTSVVPELAAGDFAHIGMRGTRNPAVTFDVARLKAFVSTSRSRRRIARNAEHYPTTGRPSLTSRGGFNTGVRGRPDLDAFSYFRVQDIRFTVAPTLSALPVELAADYGAIEAHLARLAARTVATVGDADIAVLLGASVAAAASGVLADAATAARDLLDPAYQLATPVANYVSRAVAFVAAADATEALFDEVLPAVLSGDDVRRLWVDSSRLVDQRAMRRLRDEVVRVVVRPAPSASLAASAALAQPAGAPAIEALSAILSSRFDAPATTRAPATNRFLGVTVAMLAVAALLLCFVLVEQRHYTRNVVGFHRDHAMEAAIAYVAAAGAALRAFDLDAASDIIDERANDATTSSGLATLHNRLLRCVASIKFAAPAIPALLFPERSAAAAAYYAVVRRSTPSGSGGGLMAEAQRAAKKKRKRDQAREAQKQHHKDTSSSNKKNTALDADAAASGGASVKVPAESEPLKQAKKDEKKAADRKALDDAENHESSDDSSGDDNDEGGGSRSGRHAEVLTVAAVHGAEARLDEDIEDRVEPGSDVRFAAFLFLDVSTLFEFQSSTEALDMAKEYTPLIASAAEEAITLHGGVFHALYGTAFVGSWGAATSDSMPAVPDVCEAAARAAYALSARASMWRRQDATLRDRFTPSVAITAGKVRVAVWNGGTARFSMAQVVGPPLARAAAVLKANFHHRTTIAIDDMAADRLAARQLPSKPVELLSTALMEVVRDPSSSAPGGGGGPGAAGAAAGADATSTSRNAAIAAAKMRDTDDANERAAGSASTTRRTETDGRAHELISLARHRDPDLPARLAEYKAAFSLYQRGYHAEALKGFRRYTRLYGYDGSVERIQSLILA